MLRPGLEPIGLPVGFADGNVACVYRLPVCHQMRDKFAAKVRKQETRPGFAVVGQPHWVGSIREDGIPLPVRPAFRICHRGRGAVTYTTNARLSFSLTVMNAAIAEAASSMVVNTDSRTNLASGS